MIGAPRSLGADQLSTTERASVVVTWGRPGASGRPATVTVARPTTSRSESPEASETVNLTVTTPNVSAFGVTVNSVPFSPEIVPSPDSTDTFETVSGSSSSA